MTQEQIDASLLQLQASAKEIFGLMKELAARPSQEGDSQLMAQYAARLANMEGGYLTLKQYEKLLVEHATQQSPTPVEAEEEPPAHQNVLKPGMSKTADRVAEIHAATAQARQEQSE